jgi:superfamily II DNA or RNA helicase
LIVLKNKIFITNATNDQVNTMKTDLSIANPAFDKALNMNLQTWGIPRQLQYYKYDNTTFEAPIGYLDSVLKLFPDHVVKDLRTVLNKIKRPPLGKFTGVLRDYQQTAVDTILKNDVGCICLPTGAGKTTIACAVIAERPTINTLILVNTLELAKQFSDRLLQFIDQTDKIGLVGNGVYDLQPITIGILQTLAKLDLVEINEYFGQIFCDENHISPATTYFEVLNNLDAKYKYGMSATPERTDGLTAAIFFATGPLIYSIDISKMGNFLLKPKYISYDTNYHFPLFDVTEYQTMITDLSNNKERNDLIVSKLIDYPTQQIVLLCQRKEQVSLLQQMIPNSVSLTSSTPKKKRQEIMDGVRSSKHRIVISTYKLFGTGIDVDTLEVGFMCAPIKSKILIKQVAGRFMRKAQTAKAPIIVDFADKKIELLRYQFYKRSKILKALQ